eukprot:CAMPEP_0170361474 /NCGR_PEP_ID=MMETSP0117_2-20130122/3825_1 /TAXON_ID=400756 /ORGANISM="Durinskia baltica, Strain CSIRO CS-38" /LENGTH=686 /DNA_ID=CAMNT_0010615841 /DNA_START=814 /DNA_END=2877 /DNA_ORIENTATION=+
MAFTDSTGSDGTSYTRTDRFIYFALFMRDLSDMIVPLRHFMRYCLHERFVAKTFPRLTAEELSQVCSETCSVCLCEHNTTTVRLKCNHLLHTHCLQRILQQSAEARNPALSRCPMCRSPIETPTPPNSNGTSASGAPGGNNTRTLFRQGTRGVRPATTGVRTTRAGVGAGVGAGALGGDSPYFRLLGLMNTVPRQQGQQRRGLAGSLEERILQRLDGHHLQHGDVIHIRIIPRRSQNTAAGSVDGGGSAVAPNSLNEDTSSTFSANADPEADADSGRDGASDLVRVPEVAQHDNSETVTVSATGESGSVSGTGRTMRRTRSEVSAGSSSDLDFLSTLRGIHGAGLQSATPSSLNLSNVPVQVDQADSSHLHSYTSSSSSSSSRRSRSRRGDDYVQTKVDREGHGLARINLRDTALSSLSLCELRSIVDEERVRSIADADAAPVTATVRGDRQTRASARASIGTTGIESVSSPSSTPPATPTASNTHPADDSSARLARHIAMLGSSPECASTSTSARKRKRESLCALRQVDPCDQVAFTHTNPATACGSKSTNNSISPTRESVLHVDNDEATVCSVASTAHSVASTAVRMVRSPSPPAAPVAPVAPVTAVTALQDRGLEESGRKRPWVALASASSNRSNEEGEASMVKNPARRKRVAKETPQLISATQCSSSSSSDNNDSNSICDGV